MTRESDRIGLEKRTAILTLLVPALCALAWLPAGAQTTVPGGTISTDTTWTLAGSPYTVTGNVAVEGTDGGDGVTTLTIEPGVEVRFQANRALSVGSYAVSTPGALVADGNAGGPATIVFTSDQMSPGPGDWQGIEYRAGARGNSVLRNVRIEYAGSGSYAAVHMGHGTAGPMLTLDGVTVLDSGYRGIYQSGPSSMSQVTVSDSVNDGIHIASGATSLSQVTVSGSGDNAIEAASSALTLSDCTLGTSLGHDVRFGNWVTGSVTNCTSIESVFYGGTTSEVAWSGNTFNGWGNLTSRVGASDLGGLIADNTINIVGTPPLEVAQGTVRLDSTWTAAAGNPYVWHGSVAVEGSDGADGVTTLTIEPGLEQRIQGNRVLSVGSYAVGTPGALVADGNAGGPATIVFTSNQASPAPGDWQGIEYRAGARGNSVLRNVRIEYAGSGSYAAVHMGHGTAGPMLTLDGVTVLDSGYRGIYQSGPSSMSQVTVSDSVNDGIHIASGAADLSQVTVSGSGDNAIEAASSALTLSDCTLGTSLGHDVRFGNWVTGSVTNCTSIESVFYGGTTSEVAWSGNTFNGWGNLTSRVGASDLGGLIADNTINKPGDPPLEVAQGTVSLDSTWTGAAGNPYVWHGRVAVEGSDGADGVTTLTIEPGLEQRIQGNRALSVGSYAVSTPGALVADGNSGGGPATIVFTSNQASPAPGDWQGIEYRAGAHASSVLRNVSIEYAGSGSYAAVHMGHGTAGPMLTLDGVTVLDSGYRGIYQSGPSSMSQVTVSDSVNDGIHIASGAADLSQVTVSGSGDNAIEAASSALTLSDCTLGTSLGHDVRFGNWVTGSVTNCTSIESVFYGGTTSEVAWSGNTFNGWGNLTSRVGASDLGGLIADNTINKPGDPPLEVAQGTVSLDSTWTGAAGNPYVWHGRVAVEGTDGADGVTTLTMEPGLEHRMQGNRALSVGSYAVSTPGALVADGNSGGGPATIVFTSNQASPAPGDWQGIEYRAGAHASSVLRNVSIEYAGSGNYAAVHMGHGSTGPTLTLDELTVQNSAYRGIYASGPFTLGSCVIESNDDHDIYLTGPIAGTVDDCSSIESVYYATTTPDFDWTNNTFNNWGSRTSRVGIPDLDSFSRNNTFNGIPGAVLEISGATVDLDAAWGPGPGPFVKTSGSLTVWGADGPDATTTLTLEPGVAIRMPANSWIYVGNTFGDPGELIADGRLGGGAFETVNFNTSVEAPVAGDWHGVHVRATGRATLAETQVRYADTALMVDGIIDAFDRVSINRANVGLDLGPAAVLATDLNRLLVRNTGIAVLTDGVDAVVRDSNLIGSTFGVENLTPGSNCVDAQTNWWGAADGPIGDPPTLGCETEDPTGTGSEITDGVLFASYLSAPPDDGDSIPCDDGDGFPDPCTGGNTVDCDDNCCGVSNDSQDDEDGDGTGDACDDNPVLRVSNDPADGADFEIVQDAADASFESGTRVEIFPGLAPYTASVRLDLGQVFTFVGLEEISGDPVVVDGGGGPAFRVVSKAGTVPMTFRNLTIRGDQGVRASVDTRLEDVTFDLVTQEALRLDAGNHQLLRATVDGAAVGARVAAGSSLSASRAVLTNLTDAGLIVEGSADLVNVVIGGGAGADGVRMGAAGSLDARYVTIADNTGTGIENSAGGTVTVDRSIVYGNALDDLVNVPCTSLTWSLSELPDCSAGGDNVTGDPLLDAGYAPQDGSPCLDWGPPAAQYDGTPPTDAAGDVRLRDYDGDGIALNDCGAYEVADDTLVPGEVVNLQWDFNFRLLWDAEPDAVEYHVYRDDLSSLSYQAFGTCRDDLDGDRTDTQLDDLEEPAPGGGWFYLISADDGVDEGSLGFAATAERSNFNPCP